MHIAIAGNIGAGKTTLAGRLAEHFNWLVSYESVDDNPYLEDFYGDMQRWAFHLQIYFLNHRFNQVLKARNSSQTVIQDRSIYEDAYIFARTLKEQGQMSERDYENYLKLFQSILSLVKPPDLLIYLRADLPKLKKHIHLRGREYEANIADEYLENLNNCYESWIAEYKEGKLLVMDINHKDFRENPEDWQSLLNAIKEQIY